MPVSVEVRWFGDGQVPEEMLTWFSPPDPKPDCRVDDYFTCTPEFGLKVRGGVKIELKYLRKAEALESASLQVSGVLQEWSKWDLPLMKRTPEDIRASTAWATLTKDLWVRKYSVVGGQVTEVDATEYTDEGCKLELVALTMDGDADPSAWSFGLESFGSSPRRNFDLVYAEVMESPPPLPLDAGA